MASDIKNNNNNNNNHRSTIFWFRRLRQQCANVYYYHYTLLLMIVISVQLVSSQCPWPRTPQLASLHSDCVCSYSNVRRLSVQCSPVANFSQLLEVLHSPSVQRLAIDLLYVNNATGLSRLPKNAFRNLDIQQFHLANTRLEGIERGAFAGLEDKLQSLTLQATGLKEIPVAEFRSLRSLRILDLSQNRIRRVSPNTFSELGQLSTLRLGFNADLQLDRDAFRGIERSLKNLNLKAIGTKQVPDAIRNLTELAFLDLAQNKIEDIRPHIFKHLYSLTSLSLERNLIRSMHPETFVGLNDSLSQLSLLNNLLVDFPQVALSKLTGLRVLDLGFNAIRQLPMNAFLSNTLLTLLALDGNPLKTLSLQTFEHLNETLRGLSFGGKMFECDCNVHWLAVWTKEYSLHITSRERNPQFCAKPPHLRNKAFTAIHLTDFGCSPNMETAKASMTALLSPPSPPSPQPPPPPPKMITSTMLPTIGMTNRPTPTVSSSTGKSSYPEVYYEHSTSTSTSTSTTESVESKSQSSLAKSSSSSSPKEMMKPMGGYVQVIPLVEENMPTSVPNWFNTTPASTTVAYLKPSVLPTANQPPLISSPVTTLMVHERNGDLNNSTNSNLPLPTTHAASVIPKSVTKQRHRSSNAPVNRSQGSLRLLDAIYHNNSIWLRWEPTMNGKFSTTGYQVVYRYFGSKEFHRSERLPSKTTSYTLTDYIASNELVVVCVVNLDESNEAVDKTSEQAIPMGQCRELTTREPLVKKPYRPLNSTGSGSSGNSSLASLYPSLKRLNDLDKIVIGISAAVCVFIILVVLIFSCCFYRSPSRESPLRTVLSTNNAKCLSNKSLTPITKASLEHEWENISVYSSRSIPRARIANLTNHLPPPPTITGTMRSHISIHGRSNASAQMTAPMNRYLGTTLPPKTPITPPNAFGVRNGAAWLDPYLHYPSVNHLPGVVSYGTTVTATGGAQIPLTGNGGYGPNHYADSSYLRTGNNIGSLGRERHNRDRHENNSDVLHSHMMDPYRQKQRARKSSNKNRLKSSASSCGVIPELRITSHNNGGCASNSNSSYNRLLLSSSSNSFQSQNDYDSDQASPAATQTTSVSQHHWSSSSSGQSGSGNQTCVPRTVTMFGGGGTIGSRINNDNEVDIYVDQNYAKRFF